MRGITSYIQESIFARFADRAAKSLGPEQVVLMDHPTEEIHERLKAGKELFAAGRPGMRMAMAPQARLEENYLYSSRRFPNLADNTISSGAVTAGAYPLFGVATGGLGDSLGFPTGFVLSLSETNMDLGGQVPQGQSFVFNQLGVSFNANVAIGDIQVMVDLCNLTFSKAGGNFALNHGPLKFWPGGHGVWAGFSAGESGASCSNGVPDIRAVRTLRIARVLKPNDVFSYAINIPRVAEAKNGTTVGLSDFVVVTVWLWGGYKSAIAA